MMAWPRPRRAREKKKACVFVFVPLPLLPDSARPLMLGAVTHTLLCVLNNTVESGRGGGGENDAQGKKKRKNKKVFLSCFFVRVVPLIFLLSCLETERVRVCVCGLGGAGRICAVWRLSAFPAAAAVCSPPPALPVPTSLCPQNILRTRCTPALFKTTSRRFDNPVV